MALSFNFKGAEWRHARFPRKNLQKKGNKKCETESKE